MLKSMCCFNPWCAMPPQTVPCLIASLLRPLDYCSYLGMSRSNDSVSRAKSVSSCSPNRRFNIDCNIAPYPIPTPGLVFPEHLATHFCTNPFWRVPNNFHCLVAEHHHKHVIQLCAECSSAVMSPLTTASEPFRVARSKTSIFGWAAHANALNVS